MPHLKIACSSTEGTLKPSHQDDMKGYKVTDSSRERMFGIACNSLSQLREKGIHRLGINEDVYLALDDGTIIDDEEYFQMIPPQTVIIFYRKTEPLVTGADYILKLLRMINAGYLTAGEKASQFIMEKTQDLINLIQEEEKPIKVANTRFDDPDWFQNLETNASTKEDYMFKKSQERIKGYLYKFQNDVRKSSTYVEDLKTRMILNDCIRYFREKLHRDNYFGCFFDRRFCKKLSNDEVDIPRLRDRKRWKGEEKYIETVIPTYDKVSYCDDGGTFLCQGKWNLNDCEFGFRHIINPYLNRESRLIFSTWNLDHRIWFELRGQPLPSVIIAAVEEVRCRYWSHADHHHKSIETHFNDLWPFEPIEKSRTILPTLLDVVKNRRKEQSVNYDYFYQLLFTNFNLKLVHVVCHDKGAHNIFCDMKFVYNQ